MAALYYVILYLSVCRVSFGMRSNEVYAQLIGLTSLTGLNHDEQNLIKQTVVTQLNIGTIGGSASLFESGQAVYVAVTCPPQLPPSTMVPYFSQLRANILPYLRSISALTAIGDVTQTRPSTGTGSGSPSAGTRGTTHPADTNADNHGGVQSGSRPTPPSGTQSGTSTSGGEHSGTSSASASGDAGVVYAQLKGLSNLGQLTEAQQTLIKDTVTNRLGIGGIGGSTTLTESDHSVMLVINCPPQIPPSSMVPRFNNFKADLLRNINYPTPIPNLVGLGDARTQSSSSSGPEGLPNGLKVRFQLLGVLNLKILSKHTQNSVREKTSSIVSVPKDHIGFLNSDGGVHVQIVAPQNENLHSVAGRIKKNLQTLSAQLQLLSPNIKGISPPQATTSDLGIHKENPKVTLRIEGITSVSQIVGGVSGAETAVAMSLGLPPSNVEIKDSSGGVVVVFTPSDKVPAPRIVELLKSVDVAFILSNLTGGRVTRVGAPQRLVTAKNVRVNIKELNAKKEFQLTISTAATLGSFKREIETHTHIAPPDQMLALGGSQIISEADDTTLAEIGIVADGFMVGVFSTKYEPPTWGKFTPPSEYKIVGYYAAWGVYMRQFFLSGVDVSRLTHLNYAFANIINGEAVIGDNRADPKNFDLLKHMKDKNPHLKTLLSIGGWTWSTGFSDMALTPASRAKFARSAAKLMHDHHFDGIDIDWEFPVQGGIEAMQAHQRPDDKINLTLLMQALRDELKRYGNKLLTMAVTPNPHYYHNIEVSKLANIVDWINVMSYDYNGPWPGSITTNFNAPLFRADGDTADPKFNIHSSVTALLENGLPRNKLVVGMSFYGRGFSSVDPGPKGDGLYQAYSGKPYGTWPDEHDQGSGVYDYYDLRDNYIGKGDWQSHYSTEAEAAYLYSPSKRIFIGYDNPTTIWAKCSYVISRGLGGSMIWDLSMDRGNQLLYTIHEALKPDGTDISDDKAAAPSTASGTSWNDESIASGKIASIKFRFDETRIYGIRVAYHDGTVGDWHGSSTVGWPVEVEIPRNLGISRVVVYTSPGTHKLIQGIGLVYTYGTSTIIGTQNDRKDDTFYRSAPFGATVSHFKGKADSTGITQINCAFKTLSGEDFTRSSADEDFLRRQIRTTSGSQVGRLKDFYLAKGRIGVDPHRLHTAGTGGHHRLTRAALPEVQSGAQYKITAGNGDWLFGYGPRLETAPGGQGGLVIEYAIRSYAGATGVTIGSEEDPKFKFSWTAPIQDISTGGGVIVKNGSVSITGSILGQGGTLSIDDNGVAFQGTLGDVTFDTAISSDHLKFFAKTADGLFGGGLEIRHNKFAIDVTLFGFSLYLDISAIIRGEVSFREIGLAILNSMAQIALGFLKTVVKSLVGVLTFGLVWLDI